MQKQYPTFGKYQIVNELGRGGMGVVFQAYDTVLKSHVALKMILNKDKEHVERFFAETTAIAKLNHPNIVRFYEHGDKPYPYFTMEYIEGYTLADLIQHKKITSQQLVDILIPICDALHYSHRNEIMHRDIKPSNIMITKDGVPKIMDFGLAKREDKTKLSKSGQMLGTIAYMAPEQVEGRASYQSDLYSLGATMYEALTFRCVFQGAIDINVIVQIMKDPPLSLRQLNPDISPYLEAICLKCLQKKPRKRYDNFKQLSRELSNYKAQRPILARRYSSLDVIANFIQQHKTIFGALMMTFFALSISLVIALKSLAFAEEEKDKTKAALNKTMVVIQYSLDKYDILKKDKEFARLCSDIFEDLETYGENKNWNYIKGFISDVKGDKQKSLGYYNAQIKAHPDNYSAYNNRGDLYREMKQYDKALNDFNQAIALKTNFFEAHTNRGFVYKIMKNYSFALQDFTTAITIKPKAFDAYSNRGDLYHEMKEYDKALQDFKRAITLNPNSFKDYSKRGAVYREMKEYQKAISDFSTAIAINGNYFYAYSNRGAVYNIVNEQEKALKDFDKAIVLNPDYAGGYNNRGSLYQDRKNYQKALRDFNKAIALKPDYFGVYYNRSLVHTKMKNYREAVADLNKAININPNYPQLYIQRGAVYFHLKKYHEAINDFSKVVSILPFQAHRGLYLSYKNLNNRSKEKYHFSQMNKYRKSK